MALRFADSFDHYSTADVTAKWTGFGAATADFAIDTTHARTGRAAAQILRNGIFKTIDDQSTWIVGVAVQFQGFGGGIQLRDIDIIQVQLLSNGDGTFSAYRGSIPSAVLLGKSDPANAISLSRYYYLEFKATIDSASGAIEVRLNGQTILSLTGINTRVTANSTADVVQFQGPGGGTILWIDDLYVCDTSTAFNNDFLGDVQIGLLMPVSDGTYTEFTPNPAGAHFSNVNEVPPDGDATYNSASAPGSPPAVFPTTRDTYHFQPVDPTRTVIAIQTNILARKDDEGNRALSLLSRLGGNDFVADAGGRYVNLTYIDYLNQFDVNPATGVAWTVADMNAGQWGVILIA